MGFLSVAIAVAFLIYLLLRIIGLAGGQRTAVVSTLVMTEEHYDDRPILSERSEKEINEQLDQMPTDWVVYEGATPPLELKVRGLTEELYRRFMRAHLDAFGQKTLDRMPMAEKTALVKTLMPDINARAYVLDWRGATYPNGKPLPFSPENLATMMRKDELLANFISSAVAPLCLEVGWA